MAASFDSLVTIAKDAGFQGRVQYALLSQAVSAIVESTNTPNHQQRVSFATKIINGSVNIPQIAFTVLTDASIVNVAVAATTPDFAITDAQILTTVTNYFNGLAGVTT